MTALAPATRVGDVTADVLERARSGDPAAFGEVVRHYDGGLRALAYRLLGGRAALHDALQDAYVKAFRSLPGFQEASGLGTWLYRITYNCCIDLLRREGRHWSEPLGESDWPAPGGEPGLVAARRTDLARALDRLPVEQRAVVLLVDAEGFDYSAAAEILGIAPGTVGSRLNRAHRALRAMLREEDD